MIAPHCRRADFSAKRRQTIASLLGETRRTPEWATLSPDAQLLFVVGALVCDRRGRFTVAHLNSAYEDPKVLEYAGRLLAVAGEVG